MKDLDSFTDGTGGSFDFLTDVADEDPDDVDSVDDEDEGWQGRTQP